MDRRRGDEGTKGGGMRGQKEGGMRGNDGTKGRGHEGPAYRHTKALKGGLTKGLSKDWQANGWTNRYID